MKPRKPVVDLSLEVLPVAVPLRRREHNRRVLHVCNLFSPLPPEPDAIEIEIDDRGGGIKRQDLAQDQPAEDGNVWEHGIVPDIEGRR
jgi:hypothetical protein